MTRASNTLPSVSMMVLNHNYGRYVGEALTSATFQEQGDYQLAEVVVIDDGSADQSHTVYGWFPNVRVVRKGHEGFAATLTRAVRKSSGDWIAPLDANAAADLLPVTNELFFHVLADLGHGIRLPEPLPRYRVHEASMTDRRTPGVFSGYMAGVCADLAVRLDKLSTSPPTWADATQLTDLGALHRRRAAKFRDDARRQRNRAGCATSQEGPSW